MKGLIFRAAQRLRMANYWLIAQAAMAALFVLRRLPMDAALDFADRTARRLGPLFGRHRVALDNLRHAYPEKSEDEIRAIALDMWGNMARLAAEYIYLDQLFDYDPGPSEPGPDRGPRHRSLRTRRLREEGAHHLHRPSRQFRADPGRRRDLSGFTRRRCSGRRTTPTSPIHPLDTPRADGQPAAVAARRLDRACPHPRSRRQYRRAGRPVVPARRAHDLLRPAVRDQPAHPQARPAVRLRRLPGALPAPARQPLPPRARGETRRCRATPKARSTSPPPRSFSTTWSSAGSARTPASGCGSTSAGS